MSFPCVAAEENERKEGRKKTTERCDFCGVNDLTFVSASSWWCEQCQSVGEVGNKEADSLLLISGILAENGGWRPQSQQNNVTHFLPHI